MMKSLNMGNAQREAVRGGNSAMSAIARDAARPVLGPGHGRPDEHGLTCQTGHQLIAQPDGNRRTARWVREQDLMRA